MLRKLLNESATNGFLACLDAHMGEERWRYLVESLSHRKMHEHHPEHSGYQNETLLSITLSDDKKTLYGSVNGHVIAVDATKGILVSNLSDNSNLPRNGKEILNHGMLRTLQLLSQLL